MLLSLRIFAVWFTSRRRADGLLAAGVTLAALALYLAAPYRAYTSDALTYAEGVEMGSAARLLHPHHLLYNPICWLVYKAAGVFGYHGRALGPMHAVNAAAGAAAVCLMFYLLRRLGAGRAASLLGAALLAAAAGFWVAAASPGVYALAVAAALGALLAVARAAEGGAKAGAWAGAAWAAAAFAHQLNLFLLPAALLFLVSAGTGRGRRAAGFLAGFAVAAALGYAVLPAALLDLRTPSDYAGWFFYYPRMNRWAGVGPHNAALVAAAVSRAIYVNDVADNAFAPFAKRDAGLVWFALPLWLGAVFGGGSLAWWAVRGPGRRASLLLGVPFLFYALFATLWAPGYAGFALFPAVMLLALVAASLARRPGWWGRVALAGVALAGLGVAAANWRDGVRPHRDLAAGADYRAAAWLARTVPRRNVVYLANSPVVLYARYFGGLRHAQTPDWKVNAAGGNEFVAAALIADNVDVELSRGKKVYFGDRAFFRLGRGPLACYGRRLLGEGTAVGTYEGSEVGETLYVVKPRAGGMAGGPPRRR